MTAFTPGFMGMVQSIVYKGPNIPCKSNNPLSFFDVKTHFNVILKLYQYKYQYNTKMVKNKDREFILIIVNFYLG